MNSQIQGQCQFVNSSITDNNTKVTVFRTDQACEGNIFGTDKKAVIIVFTGGVC